MAERYSLLSPRISYGRGVWAPAPLEAAHTFHSNPAKLDPEDDAYYKKFMFRKTMVVVACLLAAVVVVAHWSTAVRFLLFLLRRSRRSRSSARRGSGGGQAAGEEEEERNEDHGMVVLGTFKAQQEDADSRALRPIQMVQFGNMGSSRGGSSGECMICLSEFHSSEKIGMLPDCGHGFHRPCIEMWLFTHSNCPICRHSLVEEQA
ncbi:RING-H2 finger protein ATL72 [Selaginella moellendorffii]|uniref:RING-H2 finger protein ATL72 n=1 Tax=Selaginella moellendorffii TaxID=88036 RepID=UPI000D1C66EB|nr:RING-H2 finger protein ATL72 [Selaginella moellendorffii]|eukprot:XP_024532730.1 RING-H2 finger protein ATL72 [Selaginella moellendorffii]